MNRICKLCNSKLSKVIFVKNGFDLVQCISCHLVYVGNPPGEEEIKKLYSYESSYHTDMENDLERYMHHLKVARQHYKILTDYIKKGSVLDIGCSTGIFLNIAKKGGWKVKGLELSKDTGTLAREKYGLDVMTGTLQEANFNSEYFDAVTMWDFIEHVEDPVNTLQVVNKVLKKNGILALSTPNIDGLFPWMSYKLSGILNCWPHPGPPFHLFQFSKKTIYKLLKLTNFKILKIIDQRIPVVYSFGNFKYIFNSPKRILYTGLFMPAALLGPVIQYGDSIVVIAKK